MFLVIDVADTTYGSITFTTRVLKRGRPAKTVIQYGLDQVKLQEKPLLQEINCIHAIINNSLGFLSEIQKKGDLLLEKLLLVKVVRFSETVNRTQTTIAPGRGGKFPFLRVEMEDGNSSVAYAQARGIFKTVYSQTDDNDLVFLIRCVGASPEVTLGGLESVLLRPPRSELRQFPDFSCCGL
jgi:hypothetical protein